MAGHVPLSGLDRRHAKSQGRVAAAVARGRPRTSRDADLPSALARMVRFLPCADMTHLRACPLVGRLRARDVRTRVSVSGRIGPEGAGKPRHVSGRVAAAVASGRSGVWRGSPHRPSGRRPFFRGSGGCRALGRPGQGAVDPSPVRFTYRWRGVQSGTAPLSSSSCPSSYPVW